MKLKLGLVSTSLGLLLIIGVSECQETKRQLSYDFIPSPLRLMSNSFRKLSESAKNFIRWGPVGSSHNKYSTIPSHFDAQQSSYSAPPNYYTLAPVSSVFLRRPKPTQAVNVGSNNNRVKSNGVNNIYRHPSSNKGIPYTGYKQQQTMSFSSSVPSSYSSPAISNLQGIQQQQSFQKPEKPSHVNIPETPIKESANKIKDASSSSSFDYPVVYDHPDGPHEPPYVPDYHLGWHPPPPPPKYIIEIYPPKKPKPPKKKYCIKVRQGSEVNVSSAADLVNYPGYRFTTVDNVTLDAKALFTPPLSKVPVSPGALRIGDVENAYKLKFSVKRMEKTEIDMSYRPEGNGDDENFNMLREVRRFDKELNNEDLRAARNAGANVLSVMTLTYTSPNVSAPLYGDNSTDFQRGLNNTRMKIEKKELKPILYDLYADQLTTLSIVFNHLQSVERRFYRQRISRTPQYSYASFMEVEAPLFDGEVQVWSVPEPDSGEKTILDSVYNFGQPAYRQDYATQDSFINSWISMRELMEKKRFTMDLSQFTGMDETFESLNEKILKRLRFYRKVAKANYLPQEEDAIKSFKQYQFLAVPPPTNGTCSGPIDPTRQGMDRVTSFGGGGFVTQGGFQ